MFETVLVANRGEVAVRVIRTAHRLGLKAIAVHSTVDAQALHVRLADEAVLIGPAPARESYLNIEAVLEAAQVSGARAIHPGYGFLAENARFARRVSAAGLVWVGAPPAVIEAMADKVAARATMAAAGLPVLQGTETPVTDLGAAERLADDLGYPLMVKAVAGGGGIGLVPVGDVAGLRAAFAMARARAERYFGSPGILLERFVRPARHVEVQVLGLADGRVVAFGERDCSVQRRYQKVIEETPSPGMPGEVRDALVHAAQRAAWAVGHRGAGTVEFLLNPLSGEFAFLEMNARLQVEHPITEMVTGVDLVEQQFRIAAGRPPSFDPERPPAPRGHAVEFRVYAEDPVRFLPGPGRIEVWQEPVGEGVRVDTGYLAGDTVTAHYDPLLAKVCAWGVDRGQALDRLRAAAESFRVTGLRCNLPLLPELLAQPSFLAGDYDTGLIDRMRQPARSVGVVGSSPERSEERRMSEQIHAEMVANVWKVVARQGDQVRAGDTLVILESMKMEIPVVCETDGTLRELAVAEGDVVQEGDLIAEIG
ncbi:MAG: biotin/lipoyl-binding carrier protein [Actinobacteria bacterium]|nr:biotin/lipoyl-binding carrier protein [Actinomycetota bacterium]MBI3686649.1 biotin/lipoyl-binding carrier protein [Actinomycetota bacterium]